MIARLLEQKVIPQNSLGEIGYPPKIEEDTGLISSRVLNDNILYTNNEGKISKDVIPKVDNTEFLEVKFVPEFMGHPGKDYLESGQEFSAEEYPELAKIYEKKLENILIEANNSIDIRKFKYINGYWFIIYQYSENREVCGIYYYKDKPIKANQKYINFSGMEYLDYIYDILYIQNYWVILAINNGYAYLYWSKDLSNTGDWSYFRVPRVPEGSATQALSNLIYLNNYFLFTQLKTEDTDKDYVCRISNLFSSNSNNIQYEYFSYPSTIGTIDNSYLEARKSTFLEYNSDGTILLGKTNNTYSNSGGTSEIFISTDLGETWKLIQSLTNSDINCLKYIKEDNVWYVTGNTHSNASNNQFKIWYSSNPLEGFNVVTIQTDRNLEKTYYWSILDLYKLGNDGYIIEYGDPYSLTLAYGQHNGKGFYYIDEISNNNNYEHLAWYAYEDGGIGQNPSNINEVYIRSWYNLYFTKICNKLPEFGIENSTGGTCYVKAR